MARKYSKFLRERGREMGEEVEKTARFIRRGMTVTLAIVFGLVGALVLAALSCCGIGLVMFSSAPTAREAAAPEPPAAAENHELKGTVTFANPKMNQIGIQHGGAAGAVPAGNHLFDVAEDADLPKEQPWPGVTVGQNVECIVVSRDRRWVITRLIAVRRALAPKRQNGKPAGQQVRKPLQKVKVVTGFFLSDDFSRLVTMSGMNGFENRLEVEQIIIHNLDTGKTLKRIQPGRSWRFLEAVALSADDKLLACFSGNLSFDARVVNTSDNEVIAKLDFVYDGKLAFSPDGKKLVFAGHFKRSEGLGVWVWIVGTKQRTLLKAAGNTFGFAFSPDSRLLAIHSGDSSVGTLVSVYRLDTGERLFKVRDDGIGADGRLAFAPDGKRLATAGARDREVTIWNLKTGKKAAEIEHVDSVLDVAFHPGGRVIAALCKDDRLYFHDLKNRDDRPLLRVKLNGDPWRIRFSPDGRFLAIACGGRRIGSNRRIGPFRWTLWEIKIPDMPPLKGADKGAQ